jgi:hypothetical protein
MKVRSGSTPREVVSQRLDGSDVGQMTSTIWVAESLREHVISEWKKKETLRVIGEREHNTGARYRYIEIYKKKENVTSVTQK